MPLLRGGTSFAGPCMVVPFPEAHGKEAVMLEDILEGMPVCSFSYDREEDSYTVVWPDPTGGMVYAVLDSSMACEDAFAKWPMEYHDDDADGNAVYSVLMDPSVFDGAVNALLSDGHGDGPLPFGSLRGMFAW